MTKESLESSCYLPIPKHTTWIAVNTNEDVDILNMKLSDGTFLKDRIEKVFLPSLKVCILISQVSLK